MQMHLPDVPFPHPRTLLPAPDDYRLTGKQFVRDLIAGVTVGVVALPLALGFGVASGAGAAAGIITAIVAGIVAAVFGGSHLQVSGPTGAMTVVLLPVIAQHGIDKVPLLAILAGVIVVVMGITGMGRAVDIIPWPVVEGFTFGIGVIIALQQVPLALDTPKGHSESTLISSWQSLMATDWTKAVTPLALVALVVAITAVISWRWRALPASLVAIVITTVIAELAHLDIHRIGTLPSGLPTPSLPGWNWTLLTQLAAPAVAVAALAALESLLSARVADGVVEGTGRTKPDRELVGQGLANVASGLFGGLPATGAIARTAVNVRAGGRSRVAAITHAIVLAVIVLALAPLVVRIPLSALAGVLIYTAVRMIDVSIAGRIWRTTRADRLTFVATCATTVLLDLIAAVLLGVAMAAVMSLRHMAASSAVRREHLPVTTPSGLVDFPTDDMHDHVAVFRVDGALFYGDARRFIETVSSVEGVKGVIIRLHRMRILDASGAEALRETVKALHRRDIKVVVQGLSPYQMRTAVATGAVAIEQHATELPEAIDLMCDRLGESTHALVTAGTTSIFSYGTFTQASVHQRVYGRRLIGILDSLPGYRLKMVGVPSGDVKTLGLTRQPAAVPGAADDLIAGMRYQISDLELTAIDSINSAVFDRVWVQLSSGESAWVFVAKSNS